MAFYAEPINAELYKYVRPITITEPGICDRTDGSVFLELNQNNFNFQLLESDGKDIRFAESYTGNNALCYWVSRFDLSLQNLNVWVNIPNFVKGSTRVIYMFFGRENDVGHSDMDNIGFYFVSDFRKGFVDTNKFTYSGNIDFNQYGLRIRNDTRVTTKDEVLSGCIEWVIDVDTYWLVVDSGNTSYSNFKIDIYGTENPFTTYYYSDGKVSSNLAVLSTYTYYYGGQIDVDNYNRILIGYMEYDDNVYYEFKSKNVSQDNVVKVERRVEGDTRPTAIRIAGNSYYGFEYTYVGNVVVRKYYSKDFIIDTSQLYVSTEFVEEPPYDTDKYGPDVTDVSYAHFSSAAGDPYKLSDNNTGSAGSYFEVSADEVEVVIDYGRNGSDLVGNSIGLYPYKYNVDSGLLFLEVNEYSDLYDDRGLRYWEALDEAGWISIEFHPPGEMVNVLSFMGEDKAHMPKDFIFQAGFISPLRAEENDWFTMTSGTCAESADWHTFYFNNYNRFPYYRLVVLNTHGGEVHRIRRWQMFKRTSASRARTISKIRLLPSVYHDNEKYFPKTISIYGSNDFNTWTPLLTDHATAAPYFEYYGTYWQDIKFVNTDAYWSYKVVMKDNWAGTNDKIIVDEWEMYESFYELSTMRVLGGATNNITNIWADPTSNIDRGWIYIVNDGVNYIFDGRFAMFKPFTKTINDVQKLLST